MYVPIRAQQRKPANKVGDTQHVVENLIYTYSLLSKSAGLQKYALGICMSPVCIYNLIVDFSVRFTRILASSL